MTGPQRVVALFRKASYSPNQHRTNDTAILEETVERLVARGWCAERIDENAIERGEVVPDGDLYLNMCQGALASTALLALEGSGACMVNRPSSVLACHRHNLVPAMLRAAIPFPETEIIDLLGHSSNSAAASLLVRQASSAGEPLWIKRGDVHAERSDDVVMVHASEISRVIGAFRARGIGRISLQRHVAGPVVKFYATADRRFFRYYDSAAGASGPVPEVDEARLREVAFAAADAVGLSVFGGDVVVTAPNEPVLIDLNDWPSFAPFRDVAAGHIAAYAAQHVAEQDARLEPHGRTRARQNVSHSELSPFAPDST